NDISRVENMDYIEKDDCYICKFGRKLEVSEIKHSKSKTGYVSEKTIYKIVIATAPLFLYYFCSAELVAQCYTKCEMIISKFEANKSIYVKKCK
ncbi:MAG: hypothetical protein II073_03355, partial [Lachnospiraceae bacterium]|nr:hypothetical protein [Lachnospiraceae bacterium]